MPTVRHVTQRLLLAVFGLLLGLLVLEGLLRYLPLTMRLRGNRIVLPVSQRTLLHTPRQPGLDPIIMHTTNRLGFRGPEPPHNLTDVLSIIAIGGSTTECLYITDEQTWPFLLGQRLAASFAPVWVTNAGLDGHSTVGHAVLLRQRVTPLRPKVLLFLVGANDAILGHWDLFEQSHPLLAACWASLNRFLGTAAPRSELATVLLNLSRLARAKLGGVGHLAMTISQTSTPTVLLEERLARHRRASLDPYEARLRRLVDLSRASGAWPVLMTQPALFGQGHDDSTGMDLSWLHIGDMDGAANWSVLELYNDVTRRVGQDVGVPVIDLAKLLPKNSSYYYDQLHFNSAGCRRISELVADALEPLLADKFPAYRKGGLQAAHNS